MRFLFLKYQVKSCFIEEQCFGLTQARIKQGHIIIDLERYDFVPDVA